MYEVIECNADQMKEVTYLCKGFEQASGFVKVDIEHSIKNYLNFMETGIGGMLGLVKDGTIIGGLGYIVATDLHYPRTMAIETFWFVIPECRGGGIKLLDRFEKLAKDKNCDGIAMIHMADSQPESLERLYLKKGYSLLEKHYIKELI